MACKRLLSSVIYNKKEEMILTNTTKTSLRFEVNDCSSSDLYFGVSKTSRYIDEHAKVHVH